MGQVCCTTSANKVRVSGLAVNENALEEWRLQIKTTLRISGSDLIQRLHDHEIVQLQATFFKHYKKEQFDGLKLSPSALLHAFPSLVTGDSGLVHIIFNDVDIPLGFESHGLALSCVLTSFLLGDDEPASGRQDLLRALAAGTGSGKRSYRDGGAHVNGNATPASSIAVTFRDFCRTQAVIVRALHSRQSDRSLQGILLFVLFADSFDSPLYTLSSRTGHGRSNMTRDTHSDRDNKNQSKGDTDTSEAATDVTGITDRDRQGEIPTTNGLTDDNNEVSDSSLEGNPCPCLSEAATERLFTFLALTPYLRWLRLRQLLVTYEVVPCEDSEQCAPRTNRDSVMGLPGLAQSAARAEAAEWRRHAQNSAASARKAISRDWLGPQQNLTWPLTLPDFIALMRKYSSSYAGSNSSFFTTLPADGSAPQIQDSLYNLGELLSRYTVAAALNTLSAIPSSYEESMLMSQALQLDAELGTPVVFVLDKRWWRLWCEYASVEGQGSSDVESLISRLESRPSEYATVARPPCIDATRLQNPQNCVQLTEDVEQRAVLIPVHAWRVIAHLYYARPCYSIPRQLVVTESGRIPLLYPLETRIHWYSSFGCATEMPSDLLLTCACCTGGTTAKCCRDLCTAEQVVGRVLSRYGLDIDAESDEQPLQLRVWILVHTTTSVGTDALSVSVVPVLPYACPGYLATRPEVPVKKTDLNVLAGSRPPFTTDGYRVSYWRLLTQDERQLPLSSLVNSLVCLDGGNGLSASSHGCRLMLESADQSGWPLERLFADMPPFWTHDNESTLSDISEIAVSRMTSASAGKSGTEVLVKDSLGRWLFGEVVERGRGGIGKQPSIASNSDDESTSVIVRFRFGGCSWEEVVPLQGRHKRIVSRAMSIGVATNLDIVDRLASLLVKPVSDSIVRRESLTMRGDFSTVRDSIIGMRSSLAMKDLENLNEGFYSGMIAGSEGPYVSASISRIRRSTEVVSTLQRRRQNLLDLLRAEIGADSTALIRKNAATITDLPSNSTPAETDNDAWPDEVLNSSRPSIFNRKANDALRNGLLTASSFVSLPFPSSSKSYVAGQDKNDNPMTTSTQHQVPDDLSNTVNSSGLQPVTVPRTQSNTRRITNAVLPKAAGLYNLGNTCYMNSALQCLAHTPLLSEYFLANQHRRDLNRSNRLGTGGKLTDEFANLLQQMWSEPTGNRSSHIVSPIDFKRTLQKCKSQFSGQDQQDAQEFLAEFMDAMHEDLNLYRVDSRRERVDSIIASGNDRFDDRASTRTLGLLTQSAQAWRKHRERNRSVIADLFQGQQCSEVTCAVCGHRSPTFDPFFSLSLPLPKQHEASFTVVLMRRMPHVLLRRFETEAGFDNIESSLLAKYEAARSPIRLSVNLPRLADLGDLKKAVCKMLNSSGSESWQLRTEHVTAVELFTATSIESPAGARGSFQEITRYLDDRDPLASLLDSNTPNGARRDSGAGAGEYGVLLLEDAKDMPFVVALPSDRVSNRSGQPRPGSKPETAAPSESLPQPDKPVVVVAGSVGYDDEWEYEHPDPCEGEIVTDLGNTPTIAPNGVGVKSESGRSRSVSTTTSAKWNPNIFDLKVGTRLDAMDHRGFWIAANVVECWAVDDLDLEGLRQVDRQVLVGMPVEKGPHVRIHFDGFSPKWDEWYGPKDAASGRLAEVYSHSQRKLRILDLTVMHRRSYRLAVPGQGQLKLGGRGQGAGARSPQGSGPGSMRNELVGISYSVQCESFRNCQHALTHIVEQAMRYASPDEMKTYLAAMKVHREKQKATAYSGVAVRWVDGLLASIPFTVRMSSMSNWQATASSAGSSMSSSLGPGRSHQLWEGSEFPVDERERPICNLYHQRLVIIVDWHFIPPAVIDGKHLSSRSRFQELPVTDHESFTKHCAELEAIATAGQAASAQQQQTAREKRLGVPPPVTLDECLREYAGAAEVLDEGSWNCEHCKQRSRGVVQTSLSRLPDILVMHLKRFGMNAHWREKIRTRVLFPFTALDMAPYLSESVKPTGHVLSSPVDETQSLSRPDCVYDLFAVVNHLGGMSGGHYTAYVKCGTNSPIPVATGGGVVAGRNTSGLVDNRDEMRRDEDDYDPLFINPSLTTGSERRDPSAALEAERYTQFAANSVASAGGTWVLCDDDVVRHVSLLDLETAIVSESAYMLFYRRRALTATARINLSP